MRRVTALVGIWLAGYALGFVTYFLVGALIKALLPFFLNIDGQIVGAALAGLGSSFIVLLLVIAWAYTTRPK